jgi:tetratricopeptide (TPR) repeat protein
MRARLLSFLTLATLATAAPLLAQELPESERIKWERQLTYVQSLIEAEPSLPQHYMRAAQAWAQLGQTDQVLRYTQEAVRLGGSPLAADILVADHFTTLGRSPEAMERYLRVLDSSPRQAHTLTRLWLILQTARGGNQRLPNMDSAAARLNNAGYYLSERPQPPDEGRRAAAHRPGQPAPQQQRHHRRRRRLQRGRRPRPLEPRPLPRHGHRLRTHRRL